MKTLQELRKSLGLSQSELARAAQINLRTLQEYENGRRSIDSAHLQTLINLADVLGVPFYNLISDDALRENLLNNINRGN